MNKRVEAIIDEARKLTSEERDEQRSRMRLEFDDEADGTPEDIEAALIKTANERAEAIDRRNVLLVPWDEVRAGLRK